MSLFFINDNVLVVNVNHFGDLTKVRLFTLEDVCLEQLNRAPQLSFIFCSYLHPSHTISPLHIERYKSVALSDITNPAVPQVSHVAAAVSGSSKKAGSGAGSGCVAGGDFAQPTLPFVLPPASLLLSLPPAALAVHYDAPAHFAPLSHSHFPPLSLHPRVWPRAQAGGSFRDSGDKQRDGGPKETEVGRRRMRERGQRHSTSHNQAQQQEREEGRTACEKARQGERKELECWELHGHGRKESTAGTAGTAGAAWPRPPEKR